MFDPSRAAVEVPELARLGLDPLPDELTAAMLRARLRDRARPIKGVLLDQHAVAGIGNIYSDEMLHAARVRSDRPAGALTGATGRGAPRGHRLGARRGDRGRRLHPGRRAVRRAVGPAGDLPGAAPGLRPGGAGLPRAAAAAPSCGPATPAAPPSSAPAASRSDTSALPRGRCGRKHARSGSGIRNLAYLLADATIR